MELLKLESSNFVIVISSVSPGITNRPCKGRGQGHLTKVYTPWNIFRTAKATDFKFCALFGHEKY